MSREMKDSGIEWIGQIPKEWEIVPTKRLFSNKKNIVGNSVDEYERLALTMQGVIKRDKEDNEGLQPDKFDGYQILRANEIVFKLIDLANAKTSRVGLSPYTGIVSPAYIIIRNKNTDNRYYYYWYLFMYYYLVFNQMGDDGVRSSLNADDVLNIPIVNISLSEQHKIADYLDKVCGEVDEMVALQEKMIEELKAYKQSVITEAVTKGLNPNVPMKDSGIDWIGEMPEHWGTPAISYLATISSGSTPDRNNPLFWSNGDINWIKTGELQNNRITKSEEKVTEHALNNTSLKLYPKNTVLIAMYGQGKTRGMTALLDVPCTTNQACAALSVKNEAVCCEYLWKCLIGAYDAIREKAVGTGQPNLNSELISKFVIALPPINEQIEIVNYIDEIIPEIDALIAIKQAKIEELKEYKKSVIYEYVTGKKEVV